MDPICTDLTDGILLVDPKEANRVKKRSNWFIPYEGIQYKRSLPGPSYIV